MKSEKITLRALDRLPPAVAHDLDSELAQNPELSAELRATEDAIAAVWHAASPLRSAPPEALAAIHKKLHPVRSRPALPIALASLGWAAAIALAFVQFTRPSTSPAPATSAPTIAAENPTPEPSFQPLSRDIAPRPKRPRIEPDPQLETIRQLRHELIALRARKSGPRIRQLHAPGSPPSTNPDERNRALIELLTAALTNNLARHIETPATLVVEDGWLGADFANLPEDGIIRHRAFPADHFSDYGLLRSEDGSFYDPASGLLWTPAQDGGGYLGRVAPTDLDLAFFDATPPAPPIVDPASPAEIKDNPSGHLGQVAPTDHAVPSLDKSTPPAPPIVAPAPPAEIKASPSGYLVQSEEGDSATIIIENLPNDGVTPQLFATTDGGLTTTPLIPTGIWTGSSNLSVGSFSVRDDSGHTLGQSSSGGGTLITLEFIQRRLDGTYTTILTTSP